MSLARRVLLEKRAIVAPLVVALLANVAIYGLAAYPLGLKVAGAELRAAAAARTREAAEAQYVMAQATVMGKQRADHELRRFYEEILPADLTGARRITYPRLASLAEQTNLRPVRRSTEEPRRPADSAIGRLTMSIVLAGEYQDIRRFVHQVETAPDFLVIEDVSLAQADERTAPLVLTLQVSTYYRIADHDERP